MGKQVNIYFKTLVQPVPANLAKVILLVGEEQFLQQLASRFRIGHISGTDLSIHLCQCCMCVERGVFSYGVHHHRPFRLLGTLLLQQHTLDRMLFQYSKVLFGKLMISLEQDRTHFLRFNFTRLLVGYFNFLFIGHRRCQALS